MPLDPRCTGYTAMGGVAPPTCSSLHGECHHLYLGAEFCNASPTPSPARRHAPWPAKLAKMNALKWGAPARGGSTRIRPSAPIASFARRASLVVLDTLRWAAMGSAPAPGCVWIAVV